MAKKLVLDIEMEADFDLFGIVSPLRDYRLMFYLNKALNTRFKREEPFIYESKSKSSSYSLYRYTDQKNRLTMYLLGNKTEGRVMIPEYKQLDYIMVLEGELSESYNESLLKKIKQIAHIRMALRLWPDQIKHFDELAWQFELSFSKLGSAK